MFKLKNIICLIFFSISLISWSAVYDMDVYNRAGTKRIDYIGFYREKINNFAVVGSYNEDNLEILNEGNYYLNLGEKEYRIGILNEKEYENKSKNKEFAYRGDYFDEFKVREFINISIGKNKKLKKKAVGFNYNSSENKGYFFLGDFNGILPNVYNGCIGIIYDEEFNRQGNVESYKVLLVSGVFYIKDFVQGIDSLYKNIIFDFSKTYIGLVDVFFYKCNFYGKSMRISYVYPGNLQLAGTSMEKVINEARPVIEYQ